MIKRVLSALLSVLLIASSVFFAGATETSTDTENTETTPKTNPYTTAAIELDTKYGYDGDDLGATYTPSKTTFKVWAPTATKVELNLYSTGSDEEDGAANLGVFAMSKEFSEEGNEDSFTGIWYVSVEGDLLNVYYTYTVTAANIIGDKVTTIETQDIYSVATGVNSKRSMVCDLDQTDPEGWENDKHVLQDKSTESVVWEVHVKDFSYSETSGVTEANRGKYLGFTETGTTLNGEGDISTCIDYLKDLGVTTVQILPFYDYGSVNEAGANDQFNWGYDPVNYNVPEGSYSSNPYDGNVRITECKEMIQALHNAGFSVVMDVVFNHTYSTSSSFEAVVPNYYYRMKSNGAYSNGSGCGNETASERRMYRNFIIQSCKYWVEEYHIDGFRFDLVGILDVETMNLLRSELDKIDPRLTIWGEGWTGGACEYDATNWKGEEVKGAIQANASALDKNVALFNDGLRDSVIGRALNLGDYGWVQGGSSFRGSARAGLVANTSMGKWTAQAPSQCVSYIDCHDNLTVWDKLCITNGLSGEYLGRKDVLVKQNKLIAGFLTMAQGITFMNAGQEMGRTKFGDHNSYASSVDVNKLNWEYVVKNADLVSYYKGLLDIRDNFDTLTDNTKESSDSIVHLQRTAFDTISILVPNDTEGQCEKLVFLANNTDKDRLFVVGDINREWVIVANDKTAGLKNLGEVLDNRFTIPAGGIIIAVDKASYDKLGLNSNTGTVVVKHVDKATNKTLDELTVTGEIGKKYNTMPSNSAGMEYKIGEIIGETKGVFTEETQTVTYYYDYLVPDSLNIDPDGNGKLNINDVTLFQKALAQMTELTDAQKEMADCNCDDEFDINDITMLKKHLVGKSVSAGEVVVNYYKTGTDEKICKSLTYTDIVGTEFKAEPISALGYSLNAELMPEKETVRVSYGATREISYYYDIDPQIEEKGVQIHVKHSGDLDWDPVIWIWGQKNGSDSGTNYCTNQVWPGDVLEAENKDENGWNTVSFMPTGGDTAYSMLITDGDSGQSPDYKGFTHNELWCVIDDEKSKSSVALVFYDVNPEENSEVTPLTPANK